MKTSPMIAGAALVAASGVRERQLLRHPVLTIGRLVGVAPYPVPCEREYLFGGGDCQPINTLSSGRWTSTLSG
jgi:hypothetical protein